MNKFIYFFYNRTMKKIYQITLTIYILTILYIGFTHFQYTLFISVILLAPLLFVKNKLYQTEYLIYVYLTQVLGTSCQFYNFPYYDKCMHFFIRCYFCYFGLFHLKKSYSRKEIPLSYDELCRNGNRFFMGSF